MPSRKAICKFFNSPRGCSNGDHCGFAHTNTESSHLPTSCKNSSLSLCKNFDVKTQDGCSFGSECHYVHLPCESGFRCNSCNKRAFSGVCRDCADCQPRGVQNSPSSISSKIGLPDPSFHRALPDVPQDLIDVRATALQIALIDEKDKNMNTMNEMNAILDSLQMAKTQASSDNVNRRESGAHLCGICCDRAISHALVPCGHCFCLVCIEASRRCPNCRDHSQSMMAVYL